VRHHKVGCDGRLAHHEDRDMDYYECLSCGTKWTKRKRKAKPKLVLPTKVVVTFSDKELPMPQTDLVATRKSTK
jgi:hypothetical protein